MLNLHFCPEITHSNLGRFFFPTYFELLDTCFTLSQIRNCCGVTRPGSGRWFGNWIQFQKVSIISIYGFTNFVTLDKYFRSINSESWCLGQLLSGKMRVTDQLIILLTQNSTQETPLSMKKCIAYKSIKYLEGSVRQRLNKLRNYINASCSLTPRI